MFYNLKELSLFVFEKKIIFEKSTFLFLYDNRSKTNRLEIWNRDSFS